MNLDMTHGQTNGRAGRGHSASGRVTARSVVALPSRSTLFALPLLGVGTWRIESLTSYLARLARAHGVPLSMLVKYVVLDVLRGPFDGSGLEARHRERIITNITCNSQHLLSVGQLAEDWAHAVAELTTCSAAHLATLHPLSSCFNNKGLMRDSMAWCPDCYTSQREHGEVYDLLVWAVATVTVCPEHRRRLRSTCPQCRHPRRFLSRNISPGFCDVCGYWLGRRGPWDSVPTQQQHESSDSTTTAQAHWKAAFVAQLLAQMPLYSPTYSPSLHSPPSRSRGHDMVSAAVAYGMTQTSSLSLRALARATGIRATVLGRWHLCRYRASLPLFVQFCWAVDWQPGMAQGSAMNAAQISLRNALPHRNPRSCPAIAHATQQRIEQGLATVDFRTHSPPFSLAALARHLGCSGSSLRKYAPDVADEIVARYRAWRTERTAQRDAARRAQVAEGVRLLRNQGIVVTRGQFTAHIHPSLLFDPVCKEAFYRARERLDVCDDSDVCKGGTRKDGTTGSDALRG